MQNSRYKTVNTFSRTPNPYQILAVCIVASLFVVFFTAIQNNMLNETSRIALIILFCISFVSLAVSTTICCWTDPVDHMIPIYLSPQRASVIRSLDNCLYCESCLSYVLQTSRHCKVCGRCVQKFDHHCIWINNCIGCHNYRAFFSMISSLTAYLTIFITSVCVLWAEQQYYSFLVGMVVNWFFLVPAVISVLPVAVLVGLHCFLMCKGVTTYEFIMSKKEKEKQRQGKSKIQNNNTHNCTDLGALPNNQVGVQVDQVIFHPQQPDLQTLQHHGSSENSEQPQKSIGSEVHQVDNQEIYEKSGTVPVQPASDDQLNNFYSNHKSLKLLIGNTIQVERIQPRRTYVSHKRVKGQPTRIITIEQMKEPIH